VGDKQVFSLKEGGREKAFCSSQGRDAVELFIEREKRIVFANLKRGMLILCSFEVRESSEMFIRLSERWCFFVHS
jgi:hypothetical protein